jgi:hypothetical protein
VIQIVADFAPFLLAVVLAAATLRWVRRLGWALFVPAALGVAGFAWVSRTVGYRGLLGEALIGLFAATVLALPLALFLAKMPDPRRSRRRDKSWLGLLFLPLLVGVLYPWTHRVVWAGKMAWSCDGVVIEKYRSTNHRAPTLVVQDRDATPVKLEGVSEAVWTRAGPADRLIKEPGQSDALLNGETVELVLRRGW